MPSFYKEELKKLLSQSIRENCNGYTINELLHQFPTPTALMEATEQELTSIKGIGSSKARQIKALLELAKSLTILSLPEQISIRSPQDVFTILEPELRYETKEHFICLFLNTKNRLIFKEVISIGTLNATLVHPREVFRAAIKHCSASFICAHNHPSGDPTPSMEDRELTKRLVSVGETVGIDILDHVIIAGNSFVSMREQGFM